MTALGKNIHALEVNGSFDDCQALVKQAFSDESLNEKLLLTSANSINVARWLPQQIYYVLALKQWLKIHSENPVICVPSGNLGIFVLEFWRIIVVYLWNILLRRVM